MTLWADALIDDGILDAEGLQAAERRQRDIGGALDTNVLELGLVDEPTLTSYKAAAYGLMPVEVDALDEVPAEARAWLPPPVAARYQLVPVMRDSTLLVVAVEEPLARTAAEQLAFLAGVRLEQRLALSVRLRLALSRLYHLPLDPRLGSLAERLAVLEQPRARAPSRPLSDPAPPVDPPELDDEDREHTKPFIHLTSAALSAAPPSRPAGPRQTRMRALSEPGFRATPSGRPEASPESHRLLALQQSTTPEQVLYAFIEFCGEILHYAALFVLYEDVAELKYEAKSGEVGRRSDLAVPLDMPHVLGRVAQEEAVCVVDLRASDFDEFICSRLGRADAQPSVTVPIRAGGRVFAVLIGDLDGADFNETLLDALGEFAPLVGKAFQKQLRKRRKSEELPGRLDTP